MYFDYSYFEDEIIEGFYVPSLMKRCWAAQMEVLEIVKNICKKNRIKYFADWGTLIGAIRHQGRIPWDDDIDIAMFRKDYEKFRKVVYKELPKECQFFDYRDDTDFDSAVARVINSKYHVVEGENLEKYHGFPYIAGIDIFVYDDLQLENTIEFRNNLKLVDRLRQGIVAGIVNEQEIAYALGVIENKTGIRFDKSKNILKQVNEALLKLFTSMPAGEFVSDLVKWEHRDYIVPKKCFRELINVPFANTKISVPIGYGEFLDLKYGKTWAVPIRANSAHEYPTYKKQQQFLIEEGAADFFEYEYDKDKLNDIKSEALNKVSLIDQIKQFMPLFSEAHEALDELNRNGDYEAFIGLLADCQNVAIELGTLIENRIGEGNETVSFLEKYCELLFFINDGLQQGNSVVDLLNELHDFEKELVKIADINIRENKRVLFIPYKEKYFESMYPLYKKYCEDGWKVDVVVAPYYYKDAIGNIDKDSMVYENEGYPGEITITHYEEYDFEGKEPDAIVYQCPYDEYSNALSIHPFFYSSNLRKYTQKLIYVPALVPGYIDEKDERSIISLESYVNLPGVLNADAIYLHREDIKSAYVKILNDFSHGDYDLEKINVLSFDDKSQSKNNEKLFMIYVTTVGAYEKNKEKYIKKVEENIEIFKKYEEKIQVVWICDEKLRTQIENSGSGSLFKEFEKSVGKVIYDSKEVEEYIDSCDIAYGDGSYVLSSCIINGKKVMLQCID